MKATELQIGDWILYGDKPVKVLQLSENGKYSWVKPIPLTPKILEKNGFWVMKKVDNGAEEYIAYATDGLIFHYNRDNDYYFPNTPISWKYVHQLQHALRLCGLNELADNFKI